MTSGTKAHREGRAAQQATQQASDQGGQVQADAHVTVKDAPAPTQWVVKSTGRPVANPSQVEIVRGHVVRAAVVDQVDNVPVPAGESEGTNMQATIKRADLVTALTYACKGIPTHPSVPALAGVVITVSGSVLTAHTFDWDTYRSGEAPATGTVAGRIVLGGKTFLSTVKAFKARTVTLAAAGADLTVSGGGDESVTLPLMPVEDMPDVPTAVHVIGSMDAGELARHVATVVPAAGTDSTLPLVLALRVRTNGKRIDFAATDRFRLHTSAGSWSPATEDAAGEFLVAPASEYLPPARILADVSALYVRRAGRRPATVTILAGMMGGNPIYGTVCDGFRMITRSYVAAPYPPVDKLFPASPVGTMDVDAAALVDKITHVSGGLKTSGNVIIVPDVQAGKITLEFWAHAGTDTAPAATATLPATFTGDVPAASAFTPRYLVDAVASFAGTVRLESVKAHMPFVITGESAPDARNLVMPVRISGRADTPNVAAARVGVPTVDAPAPTVASVDQGAQVPAGSDAVSAPAAPAGRKRDPKRALRALVARLAPAGTVTSADILDDGTVSVKGARPTDDQVSKIMGEPYRFATRVPGIVGHYDRFTPVAKQSGDQSDAPAVDAPAAPAARLVIDGRSALAGALAGPVPESSAVAILPAGALAAVTTDPRPRDFDAYRDQIGMCECALCRELAYHAHHWCDRRDQVHAARVLLAHLVAGSHVRMTLKERAAEARAHRADLVRIAEESGITGEELERVRDPHAFTMREARAAKRDEFQNGLGLGIGNAPIEAEAEAEARRAAEAREADAPADVPTVDAPAPAPAPAVESVESVDQGDAPAGELAGMVREIIAGATWSFGTGHIGGGKRRTGRSFRGPIMHPALPDRKLSRDEWSALADQVHALSGAAWMRDVKGFACESGDAGNPWKAATKSTRERVAQWLAGDQGDAPADVPTVDAPAPAVEDADQCDQVQAVSVDAGHPLAIDPSKPVTVTLVYSDRDDSPAAPAVESADRGDQGAAGDTHGAHPQRVHVSGVGELSGYRFHLVAGTGCRQFGKPIRSALNGRRDLGTFSVTTPSGSGAVNIAATSDVADWSPVLALVAGIIGDKIAGDSATCVECDRSHALAES